MKRWLITGAADGIGAALAAQVLGRGDAVLGVDRDGAPDALLRAGGSRLTWRQADLADRAEVDALVGRKAEPGSIDVLVHNAGISCTGPFETSELSAQREVLRVNLEAPLVLTAAWLRRGLVAPHGSVVFVSSLAHQAGYPGACGYAATKDGLAHYARSLDAAWRHRGLHVLRVFPGPVRTAHAARYAPPGQNGAQQVARRMPPEAVARHMVRAVARRQRILIPGAKTRVFAALGRWLPWLTERALNKALCEPLR